MFKKIKIGGRFMYNLEGLKNSDILIPLLSEKQKKAIILAATELGWRNPQKLFSNLIDFIFTPIYFVEMNDLNDAYTKIKYRDPSGNEIEIKTSNENVQKAIAFLLTFGGALIILHILNS